MKPFLLLPLAALSLLAAQANADVTLMTPLPAGHPQTAQTVAGWHDTVALLREKPGFRSASLHQADGSDWLILIRWDTDARLDRALALLDANTRHLFDTTIRYDLVAENRRWPGPPWMRGNRGWGQ